MNQTQFTKTDEKSKLVRYKVRKAEAEERVERAQKSLFLLALLTFIAAIVQHFSHNSLLIDVLNAVLILSFLGCAFLAKKKPMQAFIIALSVFFWIYLFPSFFSLETLFSGILWKILFSAILISGIINIDRAKKLDRIYQTELSKLEEKENQTI